MGVADGTPAAQADLARRWRAEGRWLARTVAQDLSRAARGQADVRVVFHSAVRPAVATIGEIHERALRAAAGLAALGVRPGDVVAIQVPGWLEGAIANAAGWLAGAVVVPIVPIYGPREVGFILRQAGARVFIVAAQWRGRDHATLLAGLDDLPALSHVVVIGDEQSIAAAASPAGTASPAILSWARLEEGPAGFEPPAADPDDLCLLVYTSGTTADPKGVQHSHNTLLAEVHGMAILRDAGPGLTHLSIFPAGHVAGVLGLLRALVLGARSVFMDAWDAAAAAGLIEEHRVTSAVGPPLALATLLDEAATSGRDLSSLAEFMTGAADVSPVLIERADRAGVAAYRTYGSSEHPTITSGTPDDPLVKRATTDGRALPGSEVRIVDEGGQDVPAGAEGEIVSRGAEQFLGYLDRELNDGLRLPGGWLHTGDLGRMDADGYVSVTGRKKDIIVRGGEKISATEVENILVAHPAVGEVAVVGAPDERYGERVAAFVVLRPGATLGLDEVREQFAAAGLARQKTPERLVITEELPRTASGKVQKYALREQLGRTRVVK